MKSWELGLPQKQKDKDRKGLKIKSQEITTLGSTGGRSVKNTSDLRDRTPRREGHKNQKRSGESSQHQERGWAGTFGNHQAATARETDSFTCEQVGVRGESSHNKLRKEVQNYEGSEWGLTFTQP